MFEEISRLQLSEKEASFAHKIPYPGWLLANIINLTTDSDRITADFDIQLYIQAVNCTSRSLLNLLETNKQAVDVINDHVIVSYLELLKPVHQQWHLMKLLPLSSRDGMFIEIIKFYYYMLRLFSVMNPVVGPTSILNVLSFNLEFVVQLWVALERSIFGSNAYSTFEIKNCSRGLISQTRQNKGLKDTKWSNMLQKMKGKSLETDETIVTSSSPNANAASIQYEFEMWDVEAVKKEISRELLCSLHLFCAVYAHLLLVLDDIEFYEKQVWHLNRSLLFPH
jgi:ubiquitin-protein ligase E3 B